MLTAIVSHAVQFSETSGGVIYEYDEAAQEFHLRASYRMEEEIVRDSKRHRFVSAKGATGQMANFAHLSKLPNILEEEGSGGPDFDLCSAARLPVFLAIPSS